MSDPIPALSPPGARRAQGGLVEPLLWLAWPVVAEQVLHMFVGLTDTYLANHLPTDRAAATAAVGTIAYILWFVGLIVGAIGTGSTAIIARAKGARHRSLANSVTGQSVTLSVLLGFALGAILFVSAEPLIRLTQLSGPAHAFALSYLRMLACALPFTMLMFIANACLRGAGDTLTPALAMMLVDGVNMLCTFSLTRGWWGLPVMGFRGIATGTVIAYVIGGLLQLFVLIHGRAGARLHLHRLRPHVVTLKRILRIGIPSGMEGLLTWVAQFGIVIVINRLDPTYTMAAAHINAVRIEAISFLCGFAFATAAATLVGQSLGMRDPARATRSAYLAYAVGGGTMTCFGIFFIFFGQYPALLLSADAQITQLTRQCLFITGFVQCGFAAAMIFSGALRGAGDTVAVMLLHLLSIIGLRLTGVLIVALWFHQGLAAIWVVLCVELMIRGGLIYARFAQGDWRYMKV